MKRYREIVVKELSDTKMKLHRAFAENKQLRHELEWKPENPPPPPPPPPPASLLRYYIVMGAGMPVPAARPPARL